MTEHKHSPLPWKLHSKAHAHIETSYGRSTAACGGVTDGQLEDGGQSENKANAKFILRACNSHYELVEALEQILAMAIADEKPQYRWHTEDIARAALAKTKGEA